MKQDITKIDNKKEMSLDLNFKPMEEEDDAAFRYHDLYEELSSKRNKNDLVQIGYSVNRKEKAKTHSKSRSEKVFNLHHGCYNAKTLSVFSNPAYFNYYLYDRKNNIPNLNNPHINKSSRNFFNRKRSSRAPLPMSIKQKTIKETPSDIVNSPPSPQKYLRNFADKKSELVVSPKRNDSKLLFSAIDAQTRKKGKLYRNSTKIYKKKNILTKEQDGICSYRDKPNNNIILQSFQIKPIGFNQISSSSRNLTKTRNNSKFGHFTTTFSEKNIKTELFKKSLDLIMKNEMIAKIIKNRKQTLTNDKFALRKYHPDKFKYITPSVKDSIFS